MTAVAIFIGRFQPFHNGHLAIIKDGLQRFEKLLILIGSVNRARSTLNPFTYEERVELIKMNLAVWPDVLEQVLFAPVPDVFYDEEYWCKLVSDAVYKQIDRDDEVTLIGHNKDESSYYLAEFPEWSYLELPNFHDVSATPLRQTYLLTGLIDASVFSEVTQRFLADFKETEMFSWLQAEALYIKNYRDSWSASPFPPIFTTTDSVVLCQGHILMVERGHSPGLGLLALPGGFVEENEWIEVGLLRELVEETQIDVDIEVLRSSLQSIFLFDHPRRSQIGRVITHVGLFVLDFERLPNVVGSDDAGRAFWLSLDEFWNYEGMMHDDHYQIVQHLYRQGLFNDIDI